MYTVVIRFKRIFDEIKSQTGYAAPSGRKRDNPLMRLRRTSRYQNNIIYVYDIVYTSYVMAIMRAYAVRTERLKHYTNKRSRRNVHDFFRLQLFRYIVRTTTLPITLLWHVTKQRKARARSSTRRVPIPDRNTQSFRYGFWMF